MKRTNTAQWSPGKNRWVISVQKDNKRRWFYSSVPGRTGQREANAKADAWLEDNIDGRTRVSVLIDRWLNDVKISTGESNFRQMSYFATFINNVIGRMKMSYINEGHLQSIITNAYEENDLSEKTLKGLRAAVTQFIKYARKNKATALYPEGITIPTTAKKSTKRTLQPEDIRKLFTCIDYKDGKEEWYVHAFRFQCALGLRPGELLALEWNDVQNNVLNIQRSVNKFGVITAGKTKNAQRSCIVPEVALDILKEQRDMLKLNGVESKYIFPDRDGDMSPQGMYRKHWYRFRDYHNIDRVSPYELRHTFVSINKNAGKELLAPMVGHSAFMDTFGTYGHYVSGDAEKTAQIINDNLKRLI